MELIELRIKEESHTLANTAGLEPLNDRLKVGYIAAFNDVLNITFDEVINDN